MNPVVLIALPLILAFLSILKKSVANYLLAAAVVFNVVVSLTLSKGSYIIGGFKPPFGIRLVLDGFNLYGVVLLNVFFALCIYLAFDKAVAISSILLVGLAALNGMLLTGDLFNLFVFLEIAAIAGYMIVATTKKMVGVFNYMIMATVGSSLYLLGIVILYAQYGTLNMAEMSNRMSGGVISSVPLIFIFIGLGVETKLFPMNGWVKGVLKHSDALTGPMIASVYAGVMLMVFGRLMTDVLVLNDSLKLAFSIIAAVTIIAGESSAFSSKTIREILLYSSVAQSGMAVILFVNGLVAAAMMVVFGNVVAKFIMFLIAGHLAGTVIRTGENEADTVVSADDMYHLRGVFKKNPLNGLAFSIAGLSLMGLPMFFGFAVKLNALLALFDQGLWWIPVIVLVASLVEGAYILRMLVILWNPGAEGVLSVEADEPIFYYGIKRKVCVTALLISLCLVVLGFAPSQVVEATNDGAKDISGNVVTVQISEKGGDD